MNLSPLRDVLERIAEDAQERLIYVAERVGRQSEREAQRKEGRQGEREWGRGFHELLQIFCFLVLLPDALPSLFRS